MDMLVSLNKYGMYYYYRYHKDALYEVRRYDIFKIIILKNTEKKELTDDVSP